MKTIKNNHGQSLVEYLILTALLAVATMGVVRILGHTVSAKFADISNALRGGSFRKAQVEKVEERHYSKKDMGDFLQGAGGRDKEK